MIRTGIVVLLGTLIMSGCSSSKVSVSGGEISPEAYKYIYVTPTVELTSGISTGVYGGLTKTVNPSDVVSGILIDNGFVLLPELKPELADSTLVATYGESGSRRRRMEVVVQFISAKTHKQVALYRASGKGLTEADAIRRAIKQALSALSQKE